MHAHTTRDVPGPVAGVAGSEIADQPAPRDTDVEEAVATFLAARPRLLAIAYRIVGDAGEAEDVVQETWVRWQRTDRRAVTNPSGFLATTTSRLAINVRQSAWTRHESPVTPWLDDLPATDTAPEASAERSDAVRRALRDLLATLSPAERAAYVLRKGFGYPYPKLAATLHLSTPHARKLVSRAQARVGSARRRAVGHEAHRRLVRAFAVAATTGEFTALEALLSADVGRSTA
jgi:RNA polymerase sigma factor (sigma-70 family)